MKRSILSLLIVVMLGLLSSCTPPRLPDSPANDADTAGLANPASAYCEKQGHRLEIRKDEQGNDYGVCIFEDGSECEEWAFFRGECGQDKANKLAVNVVEAANLQETKQIDVLFLMDEPGNRRSVTIDDPQIVHDLVSALDVKLPLVPPMRCPPAYALRFYLENGGTQDFRIGLCGLYGDQDFWQGLTVRPPERFVERLNAVLEQAYRP